MFVGCTSHLDAAHEDSTDFPDRRIADFVLPSVDCPSLFCFVFGRLAVDTCVLMVLVFYIY
jgi:hypothetical protein